MNWCILIPLLTGIICGILGYLLGRMLNGGDDTKINYYKNEIEKVEANLRACRASKSSSGMTSGSSAATTTMAAASYAAFNADSAKTIFGKAITKDDLTIIEGIGPKIKELFHENGVNTWHVLAQTSVDDCQKILNSGGKRFEIHKPGTWPEQALMAAKGEWAKLKTWQDKLDGGK